VPNYAKERRYVGNVQVAEWMSFAKENAYRYKGEKLERILWALSNWRFQRIIADKAKQEGKNAV